MKTLGFAGGWRWRGAVTVFTEQACFHLSSPWVTAQYSLIGSDCQTVFNLGEKKTPAIKRYPPPPTRRLQTKSLFPFPASLRTVMQLSFFSTSMLYKFNINI